MQWNCINHLVIWPVEEGGGWLGIGKFFFRMFDELANLGRYLYIERDSFRTVGTPELDLFQNEQIFHGYHI